MRHPLEQEVLNNNKECYYLCINIAYIIDQSKHKEKFKDIKENALDKCHWKHELDVGFFRQMALEFLDKWFASHAKYIKRDKGKLCQLTFTQDSIILEAVLVDDLFEIKRVIRLKVPNLSIAKSSLLFLTKDIAPVLRAIAEYDVVGDVLLQVNNLTLNLSFSTSSADFNIFVPTADADGKRITAGFEAYTAKVKVTSQVDLNVCVDTTDADLAEEFAQ
jgi:hypothetical protein